MEARGEEVGAACKKGGVGASPWPLGTPREGFLDKPPKPP